MRKIGIGIILGTIGIVVCIMTISVGIINIVNIQVGRINIIVC